MQRSLLLAFYLLAAAIAATAVANAELDFSISIDLFSPPPVAVAPPPLPIYVIPEPPDDEETYVWSPGHWLWNGEDYFWVPGTWVQPPTVGLLWTPGYWGWDDGCFAWHEGYWARHVGFYGGIRYGGGYDGDGFSGGRWDGREYHVNRTYVNAPTRIVNVTNVTNNTYNNTTNNTTNNYVTNNNAAPAAAVTGASFNGGPGGTAAIPTPAQRAVAAEPHIPPTKQQRSHIREASRNPDLAASTNRGKPAIAATKKAGDFKHVVPAREAGPRNIAAERHTLAVLKNPNLAKKGVAVPKHDYRVREAVQQRPTPSTQTATGMHSVPAADQNRATPNKPPGAKINQDRTAGERPSEPQPIQGAHSPVRPNTNQPRPPQPDPYRPAQPNPYRPAQVNPGQAKPRPTPSPGPVPNHPAGPNTPDNAGPDHKPRPNQNQ